MPPSHGNEGDEDVLAQRHLAAVGAAAVGQDLPGGDAVADVDDRALVDAGALVRAQELLERVLVALVAGVTLDDDVVGGDAHHGAAGARAVSTPCESSAARNSTPVPTTGASGWRSGTDWRFMFEPIRARFASSCSRNGIIAVATLTICFGLTSM